MNKAVKEVENSSPQVDNKSVVAKLYAVKLENFHFSIQNSLIQIFGTPCPREPTTNSPQVGILEPSYHLPFLLMTLYEI